MVSKLKKDNKGFTIIEVLIVLAIAGLIMLIVFLAIPALQRNQRNNARNSDASRVSAAVSECLANRNGSTSTTTGCGLVTNINVGKTSQLETTTVQASLPTGGVNASTTEAQVVFNAQCTPEGDKGATGGNSRDFVVLYSIEPAVTRCIGSQSN